MAKKIGRQPEKKKTGNLQSKVPSIVMQLLGVERVGQVPVARRPSVPRAAIPDSGVIVTRSDLGLQV